jgi:hypothetical protein
MKVMSPEAFANQQMQRPATPMTTKPECQCIKAPCDCGTKSNTPEALKKLSNNQKWAIVIGGTLILYYLIYKISEGK